MENTGPAGGGGAGAGLCLAAKAAAHGIHNAIAQNVLANETGKAFPQFQPARQIR
jgi:hypothetical protein